MSESGNSSSSIPSAIAINGSEILNGGKVSVPDVSTASAAMSVEGYIEKNAASTSVGDINTTTNLNAASPLFPKVANSTKKQHQVRWREL